MDREAEESGGKEDILEKFFLGGNDYIMLTINSGSCKGERPAIYFT